MNLHLDYFLDFLEKSMKAFEEKFLEEYLKKFSEELLETILKEYFAGFQKDCPHKCMHESS